MECAQWLAFLRQRPDVRGAEAAVQRASGDAPGPGGPRLPVTLLETLTLYAAEFRDAALRGVAAPESDLIRALNCLRESASCLDVDHYGIHVAEQR